MDFLKRMFNQTGYKITEKEEVVSFALDYVKNMSQIFNATSKRQENNSFILFTMPPS